MHHHDLTKRYHVEVRFRRQGILQDWEVSSTYVHFQDAIDEYYNLWRKGFSFARVRDTEIDEIVYPAQGNTYL